MNFKKMLLAVTFGLSAASLWAAPGDLDNSFANDGTGAFLGISGDTALRVVQQADAKLMLAGYSHNSSTSKYDFTLLRYNTNGTLDSSFDGDGTVVTFIGSDEPLPDVIQQHDGKWIAVGRSAGQIMVARFNADGSLDASFDGDGKLTTVVGISSYGFSVVQQANNKLVVAGSSCISSNQNGCTAWDFVLVRYNSDGSLDTDFDGDGLLTTNIGANNDAAYSIIQQADGKLVVAGPAGSNFFLVRYNPDGSLDNSFSTDGMLTAVDSNYGAVVVIQQMDGRLVVAHGGGSAGNISLMRFTEDGALDTTFDSDGMQTVALGASSSDGIYYGCSAVCIIFVKTSLSLIQQADTQLVVAGTSSADIFAMARFHSDGTRDTSFVTNRPPPPPVCVPLFDEDYCPIESVSDRLMGYPDEVFSLIQQSDGKLVAVGGSYAYSDNVVIARYESGQFDTDNDGLIDWLDTDSDNDGVPDTADALPLNAGEAIDTDHDGIGNNADTDDDNDGIPDAFDRLPFDPNPVLPLNGVYKGTSISEGQSLR